MGLGRFVEAESLDRDLEHAVVPEVDQFDQLAARAPGPGLSPRRRWPVKT